MNVDYPLAIAEAVDKLLLQELPEATRKLVQQLLQAQSLGQTSIKLPSAINAKQLVCAPWVTEPGQGGLFFVENNALSSARYATLEQQLAQIISNKISMPVTLDVQRLEHSINRHMGDANEGLSQRQAVHAAALKRLAIIEGGPGTGKTTTVMGLLLTLIEQQPELRIALVAPTGKAAARLSESLRSQKKRFAEVDEKIMAQVPAFATTVHQLLKVKSTGGFHFHLKRQLPLDLLVVDESSMVDVALMHSLLSALPDQTRVVLVGDPEQLNPVEPGAVFAQLCAADQQGLMGEKICSRLTFSFRFAGGGCIEAAAMATLQANGDAFLTAVPKRHHELLSLINEGWNKWQHYLQADEVEQALEAFDEYRILCMQHEGPFGVAALNEAMAQRLRRSQNLEPYHGLCHAMPIMVLRNDYGVGLFNGDVGLLWRQSSGDLHACFADVDEQGSALVKRVPLALLPEWQMAWAITVHKSQGSEYDEIALVMGAITDKNKTLYHRAMIYTAITRARKSFSLLLEQQQDMLAAITSQQHDGTSLVDRFYQGGKGKN